MSADPKTLKVAIIDCGMGNLFSIAQACATAGLDAEITGRPEKLAASDAAILPGVGAFGKAMEELKKTGMDEATREFVKSGRALMGICLGFQMLFDESEEFGTHAGLGIVGGVVKRLPDKDADGGKVKVPAVGWNKALRPEDGDLWGKSPMKVLKSGEQMYFVHSFYARPANRRELVSETEYCGFRYASAVMRDNVFACQFHPERSGPAGVSIYQEWAREIAR